MTQTPPDRLEAAAEWVNDAYDELLVARVELYKQLRLRKDRGGRQPGICGTPAGYRRHQRALMPPCIACMEAWNWQRRGSNRKQAA